MRSLIAVAMIGAGAFLFAPASTAQAMTAGATAGFAKTATTADVSVHEVRRRWHRHRGYGRYSRRHRYYGGHRRFYRPYYYGGGYYPYYRSYGYSRRPRFGLYFGF